MKKFLVLVMMFCLVGCAPEAKSMPPKPPVTDGSGVKLSLEESKLNEMENFYLHAFGTEYCKPFDFKADADEFDIVHTEYVFEDGEWKSVNQGSLDVIGNKDVFAIDWDVVNSQRVIALKTEHQDEGMASKVSQNKRDFGGGFGLNYDFLEKSEFDDKEKCVMIFSIGQETQQISVEDFNNPENLNTEAKTQYFALTLRTLNQN